MHRFYLYTITMLVFIDESGDSGRKINQGSSKYFVVALVIFEDPEEAQKVDERIDLLRTEMRLVPTYEFRFNKCGRSFRESFLQAVAPYQFAYYGIVIDKDPARLWGEGFNHKESFIKYCSWLVFENAKPYLSNATVIIDGCGSRDFRKGLQSYLKRRVNDRGQRFIRKVSMRDSSRNNLVQLADMVAGSINRSYGDKGDRSVYRGIVHHREMYVQKWPK